MPRAALEEEGQCGVVRLGTGHPGSDTVCCSMPALSGSGHNTPAQQSRTVKRQIIEFELGHSAPVMSYSPLCVSSGLCFLLENQIKVDFGTLELVDYFYQIFYQLLPADGLQAMTH